LIQQFELKVLKHKILLATNKVVGLENLFEDLSNLLNKTHQKYVTAFPVKNYRSTKLVATSGDNVDQTSLDSLVQGLECETLTEQKAANHDLKLDWLNKRMNEHELASMSTVFDLLIWEQSLYETYDHGMLKEIIDAIQCPMLFLPHDWQIENLVVFHDGSMDSVQMIKTFINVFNPSLRALPLSVLINHTDRSYNVQQEKVFIDYLKLFFDDIGVQLIQEDLFGHIQVSPFLKTNNPFLMLGVKGEAFQYDTELSAPTFLFKG